MNKLFLIILGVLFMSNVKKEKPIITFFNGKMRRRGCDGGGCGHFGASRDNGTRQHKGLDILCVVDSEVYSPFNGLVIDTVDAYGDGKYLGLNILEIDLNVNCKIMYFEPLSGLKGQIVEVGQLLGYCQNISAKYGAHVPPHLHIEIIKNGSKIDPEPYLF